MSQEEEKKQDKEEVPQAQQTEQPPQALESTQPQDPAKETQPPKDEEPPQPQILQNEVVIQPQQPHSPEKPQQKPELNNEDKIHSESLKHRQQPSPLPQPSIKQLLSTVPLISIDPSGTFKYIQIIGDHLGNPDRLIFIRGKDLTYHKDIFKDFKEEVSKLNFKILKEKVKDDEKSALQEFTVKIDHHFLRFRCLGGGRIVHNAEKKSLEVYGYSKTYGHVNHQVALDLAHEVLEFDRDSMLISNKKY